MHQSAPPAQSHVLSEPDPLEAVLCLRSVRLDATGDGPLATVVRSNLPQELWLWPGVGFGWGPERREGVTLALAILDRLMPAVPGVVCEEWHRPLACSPWAYRLCYRLYTEQLATWGYWGGLLTVPPLKRWILARCRDWRRPDGIDLGAVLPTDVWPG